MGLVQVVYHLLTELVKQGYKVKIFESSQSLGGKPVSWEAFPFSIDSTLQNEDDFIKWANTSVLNVVEDIMLPGEHAFRVYPNNYQNLLTIMREIPILLENSSISNISNLADSGFFNNDNKDDAKLISEYKASSPLWTI